VSKNDTEKTKERRSYMAADDRRRSIIEAAQQVFSRTNLQGTTIRDLAKAAGVNQATLYVYFESKEDLFVEAVVQPMVDAMQGMYARAATYENAATAEELLEVARQSVIDHMESVNKVFPLLTTALFSDPEIGSELYQKHIYPLFKARSKAMKGAVRDDIDTETFSMLAFGMFFSVAMNKHFGGSKHKKSSKHIAEQIAKIAAFGYAKDRFRPPTE